MLINSAQLSGLYSHPWPQLMSIDLDLSGPKSRGRRAMLSGVGKQNSQRINIAGWGRGCVFICLTPECSIITRIKGKQTAAGIGSRQLCRPRQTQKKWVALFSVFITSVYLSPYRVKTDTMQWQLMHVSGISLNEMSDTLWERVIPWGKLIMPVN